MRQFCFWSGSASRWNFAWYRLLAAKGWKPPFAALHRDVLCASGAGLRPVDLNGRFVRIADLEAAMVEMSGDGTFSPFLTVSENGSYWANFGHCVRWPSDVSA
jgi:hypothetical protein